MRRFITCKDNKVRYNPKLSVNTTILRESTVIDEFMVIDRGDGLKSFSDPIRMLFNQERLNNQIGSSAVKMWLDSLMKHKDSPLQNLRKECTDEQLFHLIKSRHIQQPSELFSWMKLMEANMDEFKTEITKLQAETAVQQSAQQASQQQQQVTAE